MFGCYCSNAYKIEMIPAFVCLVLLLFEVVVYFLTYLDIMIEKSALVWLHQFDPENISLIIEEVFRINVYSHFKFWLQD